MGDLEYEAHWTANILYTSFNTNGGRISSAKSATYSEDSNETVLNADGSLCRQAWTYNVAKENGFTNNTTMGVERPGYSFAGWSTTPDGSTTIFDHNDATVLPTDISSSILTEKESSVVMYAQWKALSTTLITGRKFNATIKSGVTKTVFTDSVAPTGVTLTDLSAAGDGGVVGWVSSGIYYISTQRSGVKVKANSSSDFMFSGNPDNSTFAGSALWQKVTSHDISNLDTSAVKSFACFFNYNKALTTITGLTNMNTANATSLNAMFYYCAKLTSLDCSSFNTTKVTNLQSVFNGCTSLTSVNVSSWNTANVTNFGHTFCWTPKLATINLSSWNTAKATNMRYMFAVYASSGTDAEDYTGRSALSSLTLGSNWTTKNVTNVRNMFFGCNKLTLNCKGWNVSNVTNYAQFNLHASGVKAPTWP